MEPAGEGVTRKVDRYTKARSRMVDEQIAARGVRDPLVLAAMKRVPRERFLREGLQEFAYQDTPLPIESDQTISQPYIVAYMTECLRLKGGERVLDIGTGSGYAAAVLAEIADQVYTVERYDNLANSAADRLRRLGYDNVHVLVGDGSRGWPEYAPYDAIVVAAGGPEVPMALREQLAVGGRLVIPVGRTQRLQKLLRITRTEEDRYVEEELIGVRFVPLVGVEGWAEGAETPSWDRRPAARPTAPERRPLPSHSRPSRKPISKVCLDASGRRAWSSWVRRPTAPASSIECVPESPAS